MTKPRGVAFGENVGGHNRWLAVMGTALAVGMLVLAGCASGPQAHPDDPLEPYNRSMTRFNDAVDSALLKPVATAYQQATPAPVRTGVSNFFSNLGDAWSLFNLSLIHI